MTLDEATATITPDDAGLTTQEKIYYWAGRGAILDVPGLPQGEAARISFMEQYVIDHKADIDAVDAKYIAAAEAHVAAGKAPTAGDVPPVDVSVPIPVEGKPVVHNIDSLPVGTVITKTETGVQVRVPDPASPYGHQTVHKSSWAAAWTTLWDRVKHLF